MTDSPRVAVSGEAAELLGRLTEQHGPLMFHQSGGCCEGTAPMCVRDGELPPGPRDRHLGDIGGAPFSIDAEQDDRWGQPAFLIDASPGPGEGFSLDSMLDVHFVTRTEDDQHDEGRLPRPVPQEAGHATASVVRRRVVARSTRRCTTASTATAATIATPWISSR